MSIRSPKYIKHLYFDTKTLLKYNYLFATFLSYPSSKEFKVVYMGFHTDPRKTNLRQIRLRDGNCSKITHVLHGTELKFPLSSSDILNYNPYLSIKATDKHKLFQKQCLFQSFRLSNEKLTSLQYQAALFGGITSTLGRFTSGTICICIPKTKIPVSCLSAAYLIIAHNKTTSTAS